MHRCRNRARPIPPVRLAHRTATNRALVPLLVLLCAPCLLQAQVIRGSLLDDATGAAVEGAMVALVTADSQTVARAPTDSSGGFLLAAERPGPYHLRAEHPRFQRTVSPALRLAAGDTLTVEFLVSATVVLLDPVVVKARARRVRGILAGYHSRVSRRAAGSFITREEIEERPARTTTGLLRTVPGVQVMPRPIGGQAVMVRGTCSPTFFIDGIRVPLHGGSIDDLTAPQSLEGIEVYRSAADAPVEFGGLRAGCAVILLWTRRD